MPSWDDPGLSIVRSTQGLNKLFMLKNDDGLTKFCIVVHLLVKVMRVNIPVVLFRLFIYLILLI